MDMKKSEKLYCDSGKSKKNLHKKFSSSEKSIIHFFARFLKFLGFLEIFGFIDLIDKTACWELTFVICYAQLVFYGKSHYLQTNKIFETLIVFWKFCDFTRTLPCQFADYLFK